MTAFPSFFANAVLRAPFQRRIHDGLRRDRYDSGAIGQVRRWNGERLAEKVATDLNDADYAAWRKFLEDVDGGYFDYTVPDTIGTGTERVVRARIVAGSVRENARQWGGAWRRVECMLEYYNAARAWTPTADYAAYNPTVLGVWGTPVLVGDALKNQHTGADAVGDLDGEKYVSQQDPDGAIDVTAHNNSGFYGYFVLPQMRLQLNETLVILGRFFANYGAMPGFFGDGVKSAFHNNHAPSGQIFAGGSIKFSGTSVYFHPGYTVWTSSIPYGNPKPEFAALMVTRESASAVRSRGLYANGAASYIGHDSSALNAGISDFVLDGNPNLVFAKGLSDSYAAVDGNVKDLLAIKFQRDADDNHIAPAKVGDMLNARHGNGARSLYGVAEITE